MRHRNRPRFPSPTLPSRPARRALTSSRPPLGRTWNCVLKGSGWAACATAYFGSRAVADLSARFRSLIQSSDTGRVPAFATLPPRRGTASAARGASGRSADPAEQDRSGLAGTEPRTEPGRPMPCHRAVGAWRSRCCRCGVGQVGSRLWHDLPDLPSGGPRVGRWGRSLHRPIPVRACIDVPFPMQLSGDRPHRQ